jgi:hypothetical protein
MTTISRRRGSSFRRSALYWAPPLAAALGIWMLLYADRYLGSYAYVAVGAILLAVAFGVGFRAWLAATVLLFTGYLAISLLLFVPAPLVWVAGGQPPPRATLPTSVDPTLVQLRTDYQLDAVVAGAKSDYERVQRLTHWVNGRWQHSGSNTPSKPDPLTILAEAAQGRSFRCVEYATVTAAAAQALGLPARVLGLKRADMETATAGAGHVVAEVWLPSPGKWVMADAQWDVVPAGSGTPLSAVELQRAVADRRLDLRVGGPFPFKEATYLPWVAPYLYYFDYTLDQRPGAGGTRVMLVPAGAREPVLFQGTASLGEVLYVHDPALFYAAPEGG